MSRIVIYARGHREPDQHSRIYVPIFAEAERARAWLDFFTDNEEVERVGDRLLLGCGVKLQSEQLDRILRVTPGDITALDERRILRFKYGSWDEHHEKPVDGTGIIKRQPQIDRSARAQRPVDYVTITELCTASGILAMNARALLRTSGRVKPDFGWAFAPDEVATIKSICGMNP